MLIASTYTTITSLWFQFDKNHLKLGNIFLII